MHGNVWEWCADRYGFYPKEAAVDPTGPDEGEHRVLRGGSWIRDGWDVRSAIRHGRAPVYRGVNLGLRFARSQVRPEVQESGGAGQSRENSDQPITLSITEKDDIKSGYFKRLFKK